jgi:hypothetical protein
LTSHLFSDLLDLDRQAVHAAPHVGVTDRQPYPHTRGNRDHRRANAPTTAAAKAGDTGAGIRTRTLSAKTISIAGIGGGAAMPAPSARLRGLQPSRLSSHGEAASRGLAGSPVGVTGGVVCWMNDPEAHRRPGRTLVSFPRR